MLNKVFNYFSYYQWWKNLDKFILALIISLFLIGLFFSLVSTSLIASDKLDTNSYFFFFKHLIFVLIGLIIIFVFSYIDQKKLYKMSCRNLLIEGGNELTTHLLKLKMFNEFYLYKSSKNIPKLSEYLEFNGFELLKLKYKKKVNLNSRFGKDKITLYKN